MDEARPGVTPTLAAFLSTGGFGALSICGLGFASLLTDTDVVATRGLGNIAGVVGFCLSVAVLQLLLLWALRQPRPTYGAAAWSAGAVYLAYPFGLALGAVFTGVDPARAVAASGAFALSWFALVLAAAAAIAGWVAVALVRTRAHRPEWPWEREDDDGES
ncbi:hypothetical protein [Microbacterium dauci]|uniref:Fluoride ion transporter CrcB n=1 Tax=Microbacterium dauci TaxID=3048008 RepID=A0ABT6ZDZ9_9MICO|nr:hypothetical protein [Microbacterium sp. LX3-4]MDJ1114385.1 hypothetical protein [Microbacterium sp. LX3-4]